MHSLKAIFDLLNYEQKKTVIYLGILIIVGACLELIGLSLILPVIDVIQNPDSNIYKKFFSDSNKEFNKFFQNSHLIFAILFFVYLIKNIFLGFLTWLQFKWSANIQIFFSKKLFSTYLKKSYLFHIKKNSAELFRNLEEVDMLGRTISSCLSLITEVVLIMAIFILLIFLEPFAAVLNIISLSLLALLFIYFTKKKLITLGKDRQNYLKNRVKNIRESFGLAIKEIKLNQSEKEFLEIYNRNNSNYTNIGLKVSTIQELPKFFFEQFAIFVLILLLVTLDYLGKSNTDIISILGLFVVSIFRVLPSIRKILHSYQYINYGRPTVDLIKSELANEENNDLESNSISSEVITFNKDIIFKDVNFSYDGNENMILRNINLELRKSDIIGIFGKSGSGKSTFVDLLSGLIEPTNGKISADDVNISKNTVEWKKKIGYVSQNIFLLDDTIVNNILFSKNNSNKDIKLIDEVINKSGLKNFIQRLPQGLDTNIGELGSKLSGGEIQRIGIARALLKKPAILIFDESTNALDLENENKILTTIKGLKNECTIFLISHKKNNLNICNVLLELENKNIKKSIN